MRAIKDRFGFLFWLRWILVFAGSFVAAAAAWTLAFERLFGKIRGDEVSATWAIATFGSWFLLVIPFMRKKEQIWKRLNVDQERAVDVWLGAMALFIGLLIASAVGFSLVYRSEIDAPGYSGNWLKAVFGTWLVALVPFLIWLYRIADDLFKTANARQTYEPSFKKAFVDRGSRELSLAVAAKLEKVTPTLPNGHVVEVILKNGTHVPHVFVYRGREILGVYDRPELGFRGEDVEDLIPIPANQLPAYDETRWLRLDLSS